MYGGFRPATGVWAAAMLLGAAGALSAATSAAAAEPLLSCPSFLRLTPTVTVEAPPPGWEPLAWPQYHFLSWARLFDGDPEELVQLKEEEEADGSHGWLLEPSEPGRPFVLVCVYEGTEMTLAGAVPAAATRCDIRSFDEDAYGVRFGRRVTEGSRTEVTCE